jgi:hypothetical protein
MYVIFNPHLSRVPFKITDVNIIIRMLMHYEAMSKIILDSSVKWPRGC